MSIQNAATGNTPGGPAAAFGDDRAQFVAVLAAEAGGVEMQKRAVKTHQIRSGASPHARASLTICVSRRASARATANPNGVTRYARRRSSSSSGAAVPVRRSGPVPASAESSCNVPALSCVAPPVRAATSRMIGSHAGPLPPVRSGCGTSPAGGEELVDFFGLEGHVFTRSGGRSRDRRAPRAAGRRDSPRSSSAAPRRRPSRT